MARPYVAAEPGTTAELCIDVVNTEQIIDGVSARLIGLPADCVTADPVVLPLFPDSAGQLRLTLAVPSSLPAGRHPLTVEIISRGAQLPPRYVDVDLDVSARPALEVSAAPQLVSAHRSARFVVELANTGNVPLEVGLGATEADRASRVRFDPEVTPLPPGETIPVLMGVRGPRMLAGGEFERVFTVEATPRRTDTDEPPSPDEPGLAPQRVIVRLNQRALISRGLLTACILAGIVALWAGVFLLGMTKIFATDPLTKAAPASFFAATPAKHQTPKAQAASVPGERSAVIEPVSATRNPAVPAGALPKSGEVAPGLGGSITGTVRAASTGQPVGRILVQAVRDGKDGPEIVSSAATQKDGSYTLAGLFPGTYYLKFSAQGVDTVWFPSASTRTAGTPVTAVAQETTSGRDVTVTGKPATISGTIDPGDTLKTVVATVVARPLNNPNAAGPVAKTKTDANGAYTLTGLPAPGDYQVTFTADGYQPTSVAVSVRGGDHRLQPVVVLGASTGQISGTVTDGSAPLGGVTVSTTVDGTDVKVKTPTTGRVGAFTLGRLPTPSTYVLTFSAPGHGTQTVVIDLKAGQSRGNVDVTLAPGTGSVTGRLVDAKGHGLGGATVTVGGSTSTAEKGDDTQPATKTLTSGSVGSFVVNGLHSPGSYTLTFTLDGYRSATVPVTLQANSKPPKVRVTLTQQVGAITGQILGPDGGAYVGATVTATNGSKVWTAVSSAPGGVLPHGGYRIDGLQPGSYSVTVTAPGKQQQTALVTVTAGTAATQTLRLGR